MQKPVRERVSAATDSATELNAWELTLAMAGVMAVNATSSTATSIACTGISKLSGEGDPVRVAIAGSIIALSEARCTAIDTHAGGRIMLRYGGRMTLQNHPPGGCMS